MALATTSNNGAPIPLTVPTTSASAVSKPLSKPPRKPVECIYVAKPHLKLVGAMYYMYSLPQEVSSIVHKVCSSGCCLLPKPNCLNLPGMYINHNLFEGLWRRIDAVFVSQHNLAMMYVCMHVCMYYFADPRKLRHNPLPINDGGLRRRHHLHVRCRDPQHGRPLQACLERVSLCLWTKKIDHLMMRI